MSVNPIFTPVQGTEQKIRDTELQNGWLYFATDTGKMYLDTDSTRITMGGAGAAIYYSDGTVSENEDGYWVVNKTLLSNPFDSPAVNDIILNEEDKTFYRVEVIDSDVFICSRLAISGSGGGDGTVVPSTTRPSLKLEDLETTNVINGSNVRLNFTATSMNGADGEPLNPKLTISWKLFEGDSETGTMYYSSSFQVDSGVASYLDFGSYLRDSTTSTLQLIASGNNHDAPSARRETIITTTNLTLMLDSEFSNRSPFEADKVIFEVSASGKIDKVMEVSFDGGNPIQTIRMTANQNWEDDITIPVEKCTHGSHTVEINLYPLINGIKGKGVEPIKFEIAVTTGDTTPIVWLGNYASTYYTYDAIQIPYLAYDPENPNSATVYLYKNYVQYKNEAREVPSGSQFKIWEISDADNEATNRYQIACGNTNDKREASMREITFQVLQDKRDLTVAKQNYLRLNFDPRGRSNSESKTSRSKWSYTDNQQNTITARFDNFNWYNNGWDMDNKNNTYLRISNGAKLSLPIGQTQFANSNSTSTQSHTFELMFKVRNVQNYSDLVKNVTRYTLDDQNDNAYYEAFENQTEFNNYDAYLQAVLGPRYDDLVFDRVEKIISIENAICKYCSGSGQDIIGWALGSQDAFFKDTQKTVSVSYTEDDLISLSIVFKYDSRGKSMILFYLNGVITGVAYTGASNFDIASNIIEFNSTYCDIDLYKLRVYKTSLDVNEVVKNFTVDRKDIDNFDMLSLAKANTSINEYQLQFDKVIEWNNEHPSNQTMPYIIFDTTNSPNNDRLPWSKKVSIPTTITFVNTQLDQAYASGELVELAVKDKLCKADDSAEIKAAAAKLYYKYHCPSWTGNNCELVVQGTSSEYYPRRNYKIKTKTEYDADGEERTHIFLNKGPFAEDYKNNPESTRQKYWYMNNYTNGTHKWTMKVDYMESSGSYNAGFASLVGNSYTKHPLKDYTDAGVIETVITQDEDENPVTPYNGLIPQVTFTETLNSDPLSNSNIRWQDYRTSLLGFPVMAFHKKSDGSYTFIGYYRMLLDKGSDEVLGFKPAKGVAAKLLGNKNVRKKAECWEFSNNNRTYCSYRDPWDRNQLSFMPPQDKINDNTGLTAAGVPNVADSFEYRYNDNEDYIDILYGLGKYDSTTKTWSYAGSEEDATAFLEETGIDITSTANWPAAREKMIDYYKNWEKVCQWIWSTCIDNVVSMGSYEVAPVGNVPFVTDGSLYIENIEGGFTAIGENDTFDDELAYYTRAVEINEDTEEEVVIWNRVYVYDPTDLDDNNNPKYLYVANKFYQSIDGVYSLIADKNFNPDIVYYSLIIDDSYKNKSDLLVTKATNYVAGTKYYTWDPSVTTEAIRGGNPSVREATVTSAEDFAAGTYYIASPVTYGEGAGARTYHYDTQEYRAEKFIKELSSHFDLEYLATYFIMTEVFECYDSRGKNCMMASWGPLKEGGEYIWYPIFYDIDTQLGINNTGIPSFTFNIDATLNDNYSTSDSILWNNFYSYFKSSYILQKYMHLRGWDSTIFKTQLSNPPLQTVDDIEAWYLFDPEETNNIATRGLRPLIATNLDSWYKYITITNIAGSQDNNPELLANGTVGYLNRTGGWSLDSNGTYFYALQGDRSQSRQAFLAKRIDYIDSWLGVGDYARSGNNCIWGRVSANDATDTSDIWLEGVPAGEKYWQDDDETQKTHEFDAQYWLDLTPIYSTYISVSDDAAAYPSVKYDGITPVNFKIDAIESGVRKSKNYKEQLLYIYGSKKMLDIGDMSNLYWREFKIDGEASKLTRLKLGHDGVVTDYKYDTDGNKVETEMTWKNGYLNQPSIPAGLGSTGMPLLKEVNFCNITIQAGGSDPTLDLCTCEKLENFRATGSNLTQVTFADGVALNTLYLPPSVKILSLVEANLLTSVLKNYTVPTKNALGRLEAIPGLYIESFFEENPTSQLNQINLKGGSLGYGSFDLFSRFYDLRKEKTGNRLTMTDVEWCPYIQLVEGDVYDENLQYFVDNGHYGFSPYTYNNNNDFISAIVRGELYYLNTALTNKANEVGIETYEILDSLINDTKFRSYENSSQHANFSGIIYINNSADDEVDEYDIAEFQKSYPGLKIFMKNVKEAYSAKFVILNDNGSYTYVPDINGDDSLDSIQKVSQEQFINGQKTVFGNPFNLYDPSDSKTHYDFVGWTTSVNPDLVNYTNVLLANEKDYWGSNYKGISWGIIEEDTINQIYYAVYKGTTYTATFIDRENPNYRQTVSVQYTPEGSYFHDNVPEPVNINVVNEVDKRYALRGWTATENYGGSYSADVNVEEYLTNVSRYLAIGNVTFYAVFQSESVYDSVTDNKYFTYTYNKGYPVININPNIGNNLMGKITLPAKDPNGNYIKGIGLMTGYYQTGESTSGRFTGQTGINITHVFFEPDNQYTSVENWAFFNPELSSGNDYALKEVHLPNSIRTIGQEAFMYQTKMGRVTLNNGITSIGINAFGMGFSTAAREMIITELPTSLTSLGEGAFTSHGGLMITTLPKGLVTIPSNCFKWCPNIHIDTFGGDDSALTTIGDYAFNGSGQNKTAIDTLHFGSKVTSLGNQSFVEYGSKAGINNVITPNDISDLDWNTVSIFGKEVNISNI